MTQTGCYEYQKDGMSYVHIEGNAEDVKRLTDVYFDRDYMIVPGTGKIVRPSANATPTRNRLHSVTLRKAQ